MKPDEVVPGAIKTFIGGCLAVVLGTREEVGEDYINISILTEEDGNWFYLGVSTNNFHSHWIHPFQELLVEAHAWLVDNADPILNKDGVQFGWKERKRVVATELEWLKWFAQNADFGPAEGDIRASMRKEFKKLTGKELPKGWRGDE